MAFWSRKGTAVLTTELVFHEEMLDYNIVLTEHK